MYTFEIGAQNIKEKHNSDSDNSLSKNMHCYWGIENIFQNILSTKIPRKNIFKNPHIVQKKNILKKSMPRGS